MNLSSLRSGRNQRASWHEPARRSIAASLFAALLWIAGPASGADQRLAELETGAGAGSMAPGLTVDPVRDAVVLTWVEPRRPGHALRFSVFTEGRFLPPRDIRGGRDWFVNWADTPALHIAPDGMWLAHWLRKAGRQPYAYDIQLARSNDAGATWRDVRAPHRDGTPTEHGFVSHYPETGGGLGLVWLDGRETLGRESGGRDDKAMTLRTARIGRRGNARRSELLDDRVCDCCQTASAITDRGPVIVYRDRSGDEVRDIAIVRRTGTAWSEPHPVHEDGWKIGGCPVNGPAITAAGNQVAVAWFTMGDDQRARVRLALSSNAGERFDAPLEFSVGSAVGRVGLVRLDRGYALSWIDQTDDGGELRLAFVNDAGRIVHEQHLTQLDGGRISGFPRLARIGDALLVAWTGTEPDRRGRPETRVRAGLLRLPADSI